MTCFFFHNWSKWVFIKDAKGDPKVGRILDDDDNLIGTYSLQVRECETCGLCKFKKIEL